MKFISSPLLAKVSASLKRLDVGDRIVSAKLEAYSCKRAGDDKRTFKDIETTLLEESKFDESDSLKSSSTRKLLITLISTMNASFPDYDFSNLRPHHFKVDSVQDIMMSLNNLLLNAFDQGAPGLKEEFWRSVHEIVDLDKCDVYRNVPDLESDFYSNGKLWCENVFFYNKKLKKIVFFTCFAISNLHPTPDLELESIAEPDLDMVEDDSGVVWNMDDLGFAPDSRKFQSGYMSDDFSLSDDEGRIPFDSKREVGRAVGWPIRGRPQLVFSQSEGPLGSSVPGSLFPLSNSGNFGAGFVPDGLSQRGVSFSLPSRRM